MQEAVSLPTCGMCGTALAESAVYIRLVVEAEDIEGFPETVEARLGVVAAGGDQAGGIFLVDDSGQFLGNLLAVAPHVLLGDFVADAPEDDAGMVAVAADQGARGLFRASRRTAVR